ncbi:MAG TPA: alpha/beta hydrolase, partial [Ktedonobacterales bacterium]|nr:alpha/beta hydrolase [Ktedonobacterales bacterium]
ISSDAVTSDDLSPLPALEEGAASVMGYRMAYVAGGTGEPVIFLHGLGHAASAWDEVLPHLARRFHVFAVDMLGCGRSDKPRVDYSLAALATYTRLFMDAVGIRRGHLVGHSLGGGIAMQTSWQYPERVNRLALVATGGLGRDLRFLLRIATLPGAAVGLAGAAWPVWTRLVKRTPFGKRISPVARENMLMWTRLGHADNRWAFMRMLRSVSNFSGQSVSALDGLPQMQHPVLLIWGERDRTIPVIHARRAAPLIPNCQLAILPGCTHYPPLEQPGEVAALLERFLFAPDNQRAAAAEAMAELERADHGEMVMDECGEMAAGLA